MADLEGYAVRVKAMRPEQRAALLRNHDALVADAVRWSALSQDMRDNLTTMIGIVREETSGGRIVLEEDSNG